MKTSNTLRKMGVLAGIAVFSAIAGATSLSKDTQILIDKALNSPTLTVRYTGAKATLIEFRLNGESIGTRSLNKAKASGETTFNLDLKALKEGDNDVEVRLYDGTGKLVGTEKTKVSTDQQPTGPIFLESPKMGQQVQGPVEIKLGFAAKMRNANVSFFIDNNWKSLINNPPYSYLWDTSRETNGWHEVEAWVVDETSATLKTKKTRVMINNPGGRTDRNNAYDAVPATNKVKTDITDSGIGAKKVGTGSSAITEPDGVAPKVLNPTSGQLNNDVDIHLVGTKSNNSKIKSVATTNSTSVAPRVSPTMDVSLPKVRNNIDITSSGSKPIEAPKGLAIAPRNLTPTKTRVATGDLVAKSSRGTMKISVVGQPEVKNLGHLTPIKVGAKFPMTGTFAIAYNNEYVSFDVQPRFDHGVPMTPFRYLIEKAGGKVDWEHKTKTVRATTDGHDMKLQIGDKYAKLDKQSISLEIAPYIDGGRTIVPLSFIREALAVDVDYDRDSGHVVITSKK